MKTAHWDDETVLAEMPSINVGVVAVPSPTLHLLVGVYWIPLLSVDLLKQNTPKYTCHLRSVSYENQYKGLVSIRVVVFCEKTFPAFYCDKHQN